jgi:transposase
MVEVGGVEPPSAKLIYLWIRPCDMRRGFDVLAQMGAENFGRNVRSGGIFVFFSRNRDRAKLLYWDRDGFAMWYKRLEAGVFRVSSDNETEEITGVDLQLLLEGMELRRIKFRNKSTVPIAA